MRKIEKEQIEWLNELMLFVTGQKKWDTSCIWVCESHPLMPASDQGYSFDCDCGAPGMPPIVSDYEERQDVKNKEYRVYAEKLWDVYNQTLQEREDVEGKELFVHLIEDLIKQLTVKVELSHLGAVEMSLLTKENEQENHSEDRTASMDQ